MDLANSSKSFGDPNAFSQPCVVSEELRHSLKVAREQIRLNVGEILSKLDYDEWISLIFLVYDESNAYSEGFRNISDVFNKRTDKVIACICNCLSSNSNYETAFDPLIEGLYLLGRYDILSSDLKLCIEHAMHQICQNLGSVYAENATLYQIFSSLNQDQTKRIANVGLKSWHSKQVDEMLEVQFLRNLNPKSKSYIDLMNDIYNALIAENLNHLAGVLKPFIWEKSSRDYSDVSNCLDTSEVYALSQREPHGLCVIININNFDEPKHSEDDFPLETRRGSDLDKDLVEATFKLFGFKILTLDNPDYETFCSFFTRLRKDVRLYSLATLAVFVMTHGDRDDNLYLADRKCISATDLRKLCYARALIGKPKMFFIQACRGEDNLSPMLLQRDSTVTSNTESDCILSMATVGKHSAIRSQSSGSWYINDLCNTLQEVGHFKPLKTVLNITRRKLSDRVDQFKGMYITQISEDKVTLTKEIHLQRGSLDTFAQGIVDLVQIKVFEDLFELILSDSLCQGEFKEVLNLAESII